MPTRLRPGCDGQAAPPLEPSPDCSSAACCTAAVASTFSISGSSTPLRCATRGVTPPRPVYTPLTKSVQERPNRGKVSGERWTTWTTVWTKWRSLGTCTSAMLLALDETLPKHPRKEGAASPPTDRQKRCATQEYASDRSTAPVRHQWSLAARCPRAGNGFGPRRSCAAPQGSHGCRRVCSAGRKTPTRAGLPWQGVPWFLGGRKGFPPGLGAPLALASLPPQSAPVPTQVLVLLRRAAPLPVGTLQMRSSVRIAWASRAPLGSPQETRLQSCLLPSPNKCVSAHARGVLWA